MTLKQVATKNIFEIMAAHYNLSVDDFKNTVKNTVLRPGKDGRQATDAEFIAFLLVAHKYKLDPFTNEIYAFPSKKGGIIPVVGIDGIANKINTNDKFNGMELIFSEETNKMEPDAKECPAWCEVKIYIKGVEHPVVVREYLDEVYVTKAAKGGFIGPWQTHTKRMLRHKTIIQGGRLAFGLTGIFDPDEADRIIEAEAQVESLPLKPATTAPESNGQVVLPDILTVTQAILLQAGALFTVAASLVDFTSEKVGANKKEITRYYVTDGIANMKISKWGKPMQGIQTGDKLIFGKVQATSYSNVLQYLAETIEPDTREPEAHADENQS